MFEKSKIFTLVSEVGYSRGGIVSKQIIKKDTGNITLFSFDQGQGLSQHTAPFDAFVQMIEGEGIVTIDNHDYRLCAGDSLIMPAGIPHAIHAPVSFKMVLTMIKG